MGGRVDTIGRRRIGNRRLIGVVIGLLIICVGFAVNLFGVDHVLRRRAIVLLGVGFGDFGLAGLIFGLLILILIGLFLLVLGGVIVLVF